MKLSNLKGRQSWQGFKVNGSLFYNRMRSKYRTHDYAYSSMEDFIDEPLWQVYGTISEELRDEPT